MPYTDRFRDQHVELSAMAAKLSQAASALRTDEDCQAVRGDLNRFAGKLKVHLAMEDQSLYPTLKQHADPALRNAATQFERDMGGIAQAFTAYSDKWSGPAIRSDRGGFAVDTQGIVKVLLERIRQENTSLYPLADSKLA